ncbi:diguanylate cyclase [Glacieibacterium sp.]|uniref:GGDEF domain-containing protein n=1 Tax=Glacieibacterium sp. TaxID=2860237 RepID=UPI003AFFCCC5
MDQSGIFTSIGPAEVAGALGHPRLLLLDRVRALLGTTGLSPDTPVVDLLLRHVEGDDPILSAAVAAALDAGRFDMAAVTALRHDHVGEMAPEDVAALVEAAHGQAAALTTRLGSGASDLATYGAAIASGDAALHAAPDAVELALLIERLGAATATMVEANQRLSGELEQAAGETALLRNRLKAAEAAAITDPLTGVLNRRGALRRLEAAQAAARVGDGPLSVAMVDIDFFKRVNDRFGHAMGDEVLRYVAEHLDAAAGDGGAVGRLGGEEFMVMLPGVAQMDATRLIDQARGALAARIIRRSDNGSSMGRVSFSAGTAIDGADDTPDTLLARADAALYSAKHMGRDRVVPG